MLLEDKMLKTGNEKAIRTERLLNAAIAGFIFIAESLYGAYRGIYDQILPGDAMSRVANAYYVLFVTPPRLSSMGLIWNPLPSLLEIPLVALSTVWKPMASRAVAGDIVSAAFAALTAMILLQTFQKFRISFGYSLLITLCYALHPYIFYYGSNGMSEGMFIFFLVYCICNLTLWFTYGTGSYIIKMAFGLVGGFLIRYEAIPFAVGIGVCIILNILYNPREKPYWLVGNAKRERLHYIEGTLITLYTPAVYAGIVWILLCLAIMGNPLYFLNSGYSNTTQSAFASKVTTIQALIQYVLIRAMPFLVLFLAIVLVRAVKGTIFRYDFMCLFFLVMSLLSFHVLIYWKGSSFGWLRFFCYSFPICIAWMPYEMSAFQNRAELQPQSLPLNLGKETENVKKQDKLLFKILFSCSIVLSVALFNQAMSNSAIYQEEIGTYDYQQSLEIADYINDKLPDKRVLTDVFTTYNVALNVNNFQNLVVSSSPDFEKCVADPVGSEIEYLLVPDPKGVSNYDAINVAYPNLYAQGADWCREVYDFGDYKLFQVTG
ncbi:hypothetical protein A7X67_09470 [Clostridium sp. W14A]|nr:hypothetical protein A7X67_09470 [Clostridium sp. W14A]